MRWRRGLFFALLMTGAAWILASSAAAQGRHFDWKYDLSGQFLATAGNVKRVLLTGRADLSVTVDSTSGLATIPLKVAS